jgi:hypothetical protein
VEFVYSTQNGNRRTIVSVSLAASVGAFYQSFLRGGNPNNWGTIDTFLTGTTTPAPTFTSATGATQNSNPIVLGADGRVPFEIFLTDGVGYRFVLKDSLGNTIKTQDDIVGIGSVGAGISAALGAPGGSALVGFLQAGAGAIARTLQSKGRDLVSVLDFFADGISGPAVDPTGAINSIGGINAALAALSNGGVLYFPPGTYKVQRGNGALGPDNILADNVTVFGPGAKIVGLNAAGALPNNAGNQFYNVFQATGRKNITLIGLSFSGYCTPLSAFSCDNVIVERITDDALLANAGGFLRDKTLYLHQCTNVKVCLNSFLNHCNCVYLSGDGVTRTRAAIVSQNTFEHTAAAGAYTCNFPVGVYAFFADDVLVTSNTFRNIYSSVDNGNAGTGIGYSIYEGDGGCTSIVISDNLLEYTGKGSKNAVAIFFSRALSAVVQGNRIHSSANGRLAFAIHDMLPAAGPCYRYKYGNTITLDAAQGITSYAIGSVLNDTCVAAISVKDNVIRGGNNAVRMDTGALTAYTIQGNQCLDQIDNGIISFAVSSLPLKSPLISDNIILRSGHSGMYLNGCVSTRIIGNTILDGNTSNSPPVNSAIDLIGVACQGVILQNNVLGNTVVGGGLFGAGVSFDATPQTRILKDITADNVFMGLADDKALVNFHSVPPVSAFFDMVKGDFVQNSQLDAAETTGWYCVKKLDLTLIADASSASTTVRVNSTAGMLAGDAVLLCKDSNPYDGDYANGTKWHADIVLSVTDATDFVLTTGIPAGDGIYANAVAVCKAARLKAAAAIAA